MVGLYISSDECLARSKARHEIEIEIICISSDIKMDRDPNCFRFPGGSLERLTNLPGDLLPSLPVGFMPLKNARPLSLGSRAPSTRAQFLASPVPLVFLMGQSLAPRISPRLVEQPRTVKPSIPILRPETSPSPCSVLQDLFYTFISPCFNLEN